MNHIFFLKDQHRAAEEAVEQKIAEERALRFCLKEDNEKRDAIEGEKQEQAKRLRDSAATMREQHIEEKDEEDYKQLRGRWRENDAAKARFIREAHEHKEEELRQRRQLQDERADQLRQAQGKREVVWKVRDERIRKAEALKLEQILEVKAERERVAKVKYLAHCNYIVEQAKERHPIFEAQLERTEERRLAQVAEDEAVKGYHEGRSLPKPVKTKGSTMKLKAAEAAAAEETPLSPKSPSKDSPKKGKKKEKETEEEKLDKANREATERALESVESKMRAELAEEARRNETNALREETLQAREQKREEKDQARMKAYRGKCREEETRKERSRGERRIIREQRTQDQVKADEQKLQERERLRRVREANIARFEQQRFEKLEAPRSDPPLITA